MGSGRLLHKDYSLKYYTMHHTPQIPGDKFLVSILPLIVFITIFVSVSCTNAPPSSSGSVPAIDVEVALGEARVVDLSEIASDIRYVPLETNASSLLRDFSQIIYEEGKLYIGMRNFKIFSNEGKYLWTFDKSGRGPGEYTYINDFYRENNTGNLIVDVYSNENITLNVYDSTGLFINRKTFPFPDSVKTGASFLLENGYMLVAAPSVSEQRVDYWALVMDSEANVISRLKPPYSIGERGVATGDIVVSPRSGDNRDIPNLVSNPSPFIYDMAGLIRLYSPHADTIYTINTDYGFVPVFHIGYGSIPSANEKPENTGGYGRGKYISLLPKEYKEWDKYLLLAWLMNDYSSEYYLDTLNVRDYSSVRKHTTTYGLYYKEGGEFTFMKQPVKGMYGFRDDLAGGPPFIPSYISSDGKYAVSLIPLQTIEKFLSSNPGESRFAEIAKRISIEDNPVAVIVTLR